MIKKIYYYIDKKGVALIDFLIFHRKYKTLIKKLLMNFLLKKFKSIMVENYNRTRVFYCY